MQVRAQAQLVQQVQEEEPLVSALESPLLHGLPPPAWALKEALPLPAQALTEPQ